MVRAIPNNPWRCAEFLEHVRPGFAVSAALHVGLLFTLAYFLAFQPTVPIKPADPGPILQYYEIPKPKPNIAPKNPPIRLDPAPVLEKFNTTVDPLPIPVERDYSRKQPDETKIEPPAPPVIINPKPIYRGGLIYPERAAEAGKGGYVVFSFVIRKDGSVGDPQVIEEVPDGYGFAAAAKKAFPKWRFDPKLVDGKPIDAPAQIKVTFQLN